MHGRAPDVPGACDREGAGNTATMTAYRCLACEQTVGTESESRPCPNCGERGLLVPLERIEPSPREYRAVTSRS